MGRGGRSGPPMAQRFWSSCSCRRLPDVRRPRRVSCRDLSANIRYRMFGDNLPKVGLIHTLVLHEFGDNGLIQRTVPAVGVPPTERFWYHIPVTEHRRENAAASAAALALALAAVCAFPVPAAAEVPESVEWRDQVVYFLMTDRFADGDHTNNDQKAGEFNPADGGLYSGGDLAGVRSKLDYIQGLGATAVWLTPPVANVWYDPVLKMAGYHGYWATDFKKVDAHPRHTGKTTAWPRTCTARGCFSSRTSSRTTPGISSPIRVPAILGPGQELPPEGRHGPPRPTQHLLRERRGGSRGPASGVSLDARCGGFQDEAQLTTGQVSGLDDIDTSNPLVRRTRGILRLLD